MSNPSLANTSRWLIAFIIVMTAHIALAVLLMVKWDPTPPPLSAPPAAIMLEFAPIPEAPNNNLKPDPAPLDQVASNPTPVEPDPIDEPEPLPIPDPITAPKPKVVIAPKKPKPIKRPIKKPVEKPIEKPKEITQDTKPKADVTSHASTVSDNPSDRIAAPVTTASTKPSKAQITWKSQLFSRLVRYKRYPREARYKGQQGTVTVNFTINTQGMVTNKKIVKSSGYPLLDQEVLDLLDRASPLPKPPADLLQGNDHKNITIPLSFGLKRGR